MTYARAARELRRAGGRQLCPCPCMPGKSPRRRAPVPSRLDVDPIEGAAGHPAFRYVSDQLFEYDGPRRAPARKNTQRVLGFEPTTSLDAMLDEVIPWIKEAIRTGRI